MKLGADMRRRTLGKAFVAAAAVALIPGCQSDDATVASGDGRGERGGVSGGRKSPPKSEAKISVHPAAGAKDVPLNAVVKVGVTDGTLTSVDIRDDDGTAVEGQFDAGKTMWTATQTLSGETTYQVKATATDAKGRTATVEQSFSTVVPTAVLGTDIVPLDGQTVGVGQPIVVKFTEPIKEELRPDLERRLVIECSKPAEGAWHWFNDEEVHYRPRRYWPENSTVTLRINTLGATNGDGAWGIKNKVKTFKIGRSVIFKVDLRKHQMQVYISGRLARTIPVTGGKKGWETRSGTKVVLERRTDIRFRNEAIAAPEEYDLIAPYGLRITWSGEFLHTADWSVAHHGRANVSHGCVGMNYENSKWVWEIAHVGDPVETISPNGDPMDIYGNGWGDWNLSWEDWVAGSALA